MLKNLKLGKSLVFIDVKTTGFMPTNDRIVDLSILKIHPDASIPVEATTIHAIKNDGISDEPSFSQYVKSMRDFLEVCDIAGFNAIKSGLLFIEVEFSRRGRYYVDSQIILHLREDRDLTAVYRKYCDRETNNAHNTMTDIKVSAEILEDQLEIHQDLPRGASGFNSPYCKSNERYIDAGDKFIWTRVRSSV